MDDGVASRRWTFGACACRAAASQRTDAAAAGFRMRISPLELQALAVRGDQEPRIRNPRRPGLGAEVRAGDLAVIQRIQVDGDDLGSGQGRADGQGLGGVHHDRPVAEESEAHGGFPREKGGSGWEGYQGRGYLSFVRLPGAFPPGHECPGYDSTEKPGEPGSWRSGSDFGAGFSRLFVSSVARAFMPGRGGRSQSDKVGLTFSLCSPERWEEGWEREGWESEGLPKGQHSPTGN